VDGEEVEACLADQELLDNVNAVALKGSAMGVTSTPTFFVNGEMYPGSMSIEQFSEIIDPLLEEGANEGEDNAQ
jgi:protein-disulfide isomerase